MKPQKISEEMRRLAKVEDNIIPLFPITGGKTPQSGYWLDALPVGTLFIAQTRKGYSLWLDEYRIMRREETDGETIVLLKHNRRDGEDRTTWTWFDTGEFCNENRLRKVL